ncbi:MAG: hypothetical protein KJP01_07140 [Gramella sp.]|nr:hypothetical protein [Christiangramia sp.]
MKRSGNIRVLAFEKFQSLIVAILGAICGLIYSVGGFMVDLLVSLNLVESVETSGLSYGTVLAFGALLVMPVIGAFAGFLFGLAEALVFNLFSGWIKDVDLNFSQKK